MRAAALCMGIGGLDLAAEAVYGCELAWCAEWDAAPSSVIERHWPGVPNYRDLTSIDWAECEPVDILTAGYPCQPFSHAGKRKGTDDARHLWPYVAEAVRVAGHLSLGFGDVLRDLAEAGFDAEWCVLRASDVGAPHRRERVFIVAADASSDAWRLRQRDLGLAPDADGEGQQGSIPPIPHRRDGAAGRPDLNLLPTPTAHMEDEGRRNLEDAVALLPTPVVNDMGAGKTPEQWDAWTERMREAHGNGNGHGPSLAIEAQRLLPTPTVGDSRNSRNATAGRSVGATGHHAGVTLSDVAYQGSWGKYELAIRRWEERTRPAPAPTIEGSKGQAKLSPAFVEWMQGYPAGWCDGLTDNQQLKAYGNSVCPQQGMAAVALLEAAHTEAVAA